MFTSAFQCNSFLMSVFTLATTCMPSLKERPVSLGLQKRNNNNNYKHETMDSSLRAVFTVNMKLPIYHNNIIFDLILEKL